MDNQSLSPPQSTPPPPPPPPKQLPHVLKDSHRVEDCLEEGEE